jgi:hypothetical protein
VVTETNRPGDATRINAVIAASPEGAEILIRGACLIDEPIRLLGNRSYRGESRTGTVLKQADGAGLVALMASSVFLDNKPWTGSPVSIRHLQLDGNRQGNPGSATAGLVLRSWLRVVEDVHVRDTGSDGLRLTNLSADGTGLKTTQVNGRIANCFIERSGRHGIFVEDTQNAVTDWILTDNRIASSGVDGIHLDNAAGCPGAAEPQHPRRPAPGQRHSGWRCLLPPGRPRPVAMHRNPRRDPVTRRFVKFAASRPFMRLSCEALNVPF